jgi:putative restriction endonuclease
VVDAAHIRPYAAGGEHSVANGLPLRRDVHRLFDLGYVGVRPDYRFAVSTALRDQFDNGRVYYELEGRPLQAPADAADRADPTLLDWHYEEVFRR